LDSDNKGTDINVSAWLPVNLDKAYDPPVTKSDILHIRISVEGKV